MKKITRLLMLLLGITLILSSCTGGEAEVTTELPDSGEATEAPEVGNITFIADGATEYKMIRSENASDALTDAFIKLRSAIKDTYGVQITLGDDFEKPGTDPATRHPYEIVVGDTNREESAKALEGLSYNDSVITVIGTRLVITGGNDDAVVRAVDTFIEKYVKATTCTNKNRISNRHTVILQYFNVISHKSTNF